MYNFTRDLIYFIKRDGTNDNPYQSITEHITVLYDKAFLQEVPVEAFRVVAKVDTTVLSEVSRIEDVRTTSQYFVNYRQGIVYFHSSRNNQTVTLEYRGQGVLLYPASRIYIDGEGGNLDAVKTLKQLIQDGDTALGAIQELDGYIDMLNGALETVDIAVINSNNALNTVNNMQQALEDDENIRKSNENTRISNENNRISKEAQRVSAENTRVARETIRENAEDNRVTAEQARDTAEDTRVYNESLRANSENTRISNERNRVDAEEARVTNENLRQANESQRITSESERASRELERASAETIRLSNEATREDSEQIRIANELARVSSENDRVESESLRIANENSRQSEFQNIVSQAESINQIAEAKISEMEGISEGLIEDVDTLIYNTSYTGDFDIDSNYKKNNVVSYNGSSYIAKQDTVGNLPTNEVYWGLLAVRGVDGTGAVSSVNGVSPDENGNVAINPEQIGAERTSRKGVADGYAGLDSNAKVPLSQIPDTLKQQVYVVLDSTARLALTNLISGDKAYETSTGNSYIYDGSQWLMMADADWENVALDWINIIGKPTSSVEDIDSSVLNSHTHTNKDILDKFSIVDNKLRFDGEEVGSVESVNGMTGAVTLTASTVGAYAKSETYSKSEVDSISSVLQGELNNKISSSEKGVANGVATLNADGKVVDANGNEVEGSVRSVNGMTGDITGLETVQDSDAKMNTHKEDASFMHVEILDSEPTTFDKTVLLFIRKGVVDEMPSTIDLGLFNYEDDGNPIDLGLFNYEDSGEDSIDEGTF